MKKSQLKIVQIIDECKKHIDRLRFAKDNMKNIMPLSVSRYERLANEDIVYIDQYIYRFAKLQDAIGQKLLKALLDYLGESVVNKSFRDIFDRLEQIGIIKDFDKWNSLREIRNELSHEYGDDVKENVERLNIIFEKDKALINYFNRVEKYYVKTSGKTKINFKGKNLKAKR